MKKKIILFLLIVGLTFLSFGCASNFYSDEDKEDAIAIALEFIETENASITDLELHLKRNGYQHLVIKHVFENINVDWYSEARDIVEYELQVTMYHDEPRSKEYLHKMLIGDGFDVDMVNELSLMAESPEYLEAHTKAHTLSIEVDDVDRILSPLLLASFNTPHRFTSELLELGYSYPDIEMIMEYANLNWLAEASDSIDIMAKDTKDLDTIEYYLDFYEFEGITAEDIINYREDKSYVVKPDNTIKEPSEFSKSSAVEYAKELLKSDPYSYSGIYEELVEVGFSSNTAYYGADNCGADWYDEAYRLATSYLDSDQDITKSDLQVILANNGFSKDAEKAAESAKLNYPYGNTN